MNGCCELCGCCCRDDLTYEERKITPCKSESWENDTDDDS